MIRRSGRRELEEFEVPTTAKPKLKAETNGENIARTAENQFNFVEQHNCKLGNRPRLPAGMYF